MTPEERRRLGEDTYRDVMQAEPPPARGAFGGIGRFDQEFAELWNRGGLDRKERRWLTLAVLAGQSATKPLRAHVYGALRSGDIAVDELSEGVLHFSGYRGFGRAEVFNDFLWEVADELELSPASSAPLSRAWADDDERTATGREWLESTMLFPPPPTDMDVAVRDGVLRTVFAELWPRGGLTRRERRLITVACAATSMAATPVTVHVQGALESGDLTIEDMHEVNLHLAFYTGWPQAAQMSGAAHTAHAAIEAKRSSAS